MSDDAQDELGSNLEPASAPAPRAKRKAKADTDGTWIILEENSDIPPTGLFVGVNGLGFLVKAGEPVKVPPSVIGVLNDAVTSMPVVDPGSGKVLGHRERMRFPYRRIEAPADAE